MKAPISVIEAPEFIKFAKKHLTYDETADLVAYLSTKYDEGVIIQGTGGLRKIRFARQNQGKSGGYRIIYYFYDEETPLFLLNGFAKNEMDNLTQADKNGFKKSLPIMINNYKRRES